ncbi:MAG: ATP-binding cassette domain-containing protein, partial [Lachnospiraceae bacterium]|nr:ATP-binding cassette domain-containing protein [Lachnospiraceae bacterium]
RAEELIEALDMGTFRKKRVDKLSGGQRRRVNLATALMCDPRYILLDEPLAGIDSEGAVRILELLKREHEKGRALLVTEHLMKDLITFADRIITLSGGKIEKEEDLRG